MHADESFAPYMLISEASSLNWRQKCYEHFSGRVAFLFLWLLLLADVGVSIQFNIFLITLNIKISSDAATPSPDSIIILHTAEPAGSDPTNELDDHYTQWLCFQVVDTLSCCIFLIMVARSVHFVGYFIILKSLIRLPRFWILVFFLVLYIGGTFLKLITFSVSPTPMHIAYWATDFLNAFIKVALVGALNQVQIRNVVRSRHERWLLKGTLVAIWFHLLCLLAGSAINIFYDFRLSVVSDVNNSSRSFSSTVAQALLLPFVAKTTELIWTKILQDDKCIIGKHKSNAIELL